jgi:hypothetical protein
MIFLTFTVRFNFEEVLAGEGIELKQEIFMKSVPKSFVRTKLLVTYVGECFKLAEFFFLLLLK